MRILRNVTLGNADLLAVCALADGRFVAVGRGGSCWIRTSSKWSRVNLAFDEDLYGVCRDGGGFVAVGGNLDVGGQSKCISVLGADVRIQPSGVQSLLLAVDSADDGTIWACGFNGDIVRRLGGVWEQVCELDEFEHLFDLNVAPNGVVLVGMNGHVHNRALDGTWQSMRLGADHWMGVTRSLADRIRIVGVNGASADGLHVTRHGQSAWQCVTPVRAGFVAAGTAGAVEHDGEAERVGHKTWYGVAAAEGLVVLVGADGQVAEVTFDP